MRFIKDKPYFKLFSLLGKKRKNQLYLLIFLLIINGITESFSIASIIPFLSIATSKKDIYQLPLINKYISFWGINDIPKLFLIFTLLLSFFIVFSTILRIFNIAYISRISAKISIDLSYLIINNNMYIRYEKYTRGNSSQVISLALEKVTAAASAINSLLTVFSSSILSISILFSLILLNWKFTLMVLIFVFFYYFIIYRKVREILNINGQTISKLIPKRLRVLNEAFEGFRDVILNEKEKVYINLFNDLDSKIKLSTANSEIIVTSPRLLIEGMTLLVITVIGYFLLSSDLNPISYVPLIGTFLYSFQKLLPMTQQLYSAWANYKFKYEVINDIVEDIKINKDNERKYNLTKKVKFKKNIILKNVDFNYKNSRNILKNVNIKINKGDLIGVYGKTGSGKSTFLDLIMGLLTPTSGEIIIDDSKKISQNINKYWLANIEHVPQKIFLRDDSIAENIAFGEISENIDFDKLIRASKIADIYDFITSKEDGFKTLVGERGIILSGGQKQRIAIARAIYKYKNLLVLDEATNALDEETEEKILNSILKMDKNLTVILVTHRMQTLKICHRVFQVKDNTVIEER